MRRETRVTDPEHDCNNRNDNPSHQHLQREDVKPYRSNPTTSQRDAARFTQQALCL
jgi:hypothetical protein